MTMKKKKKAVKTLSVTSMLKKFQKEKEKERQKMVADITSATTTPMFPADTAGGSGSGLTDPLLSLIGSTNDHALIQAANTVDFDIDLDSLLDVSEENLSPKSHPQPTTETQLIQTRTDETQVNGLPEAEPKVSNPAVPFFPKPGPEHIQQLTEPSLVVPPQRAPLPEGLPQALEDSIRSLMVVRDLICEILRICVLKDEIDKSWTDKINKLFRLPRHQKGSQSSSFLIQISTQSCWSELSYNIALFDLM